MNPEELLKSYPALLIVFMIAKYFCDAVMAWGKQNDTFDVERWEGLIAHAFLEAEKSGSTATEKLSIALGVFADQYEQHYGKSPTLKDRNDARLDFSRLALEATLARGGSIPVQNLPTTIAVPAVDQIRG